MYHRHECFNPFVVRAVPPPGSFISRSSTPGRGRPPTLLRTYFAKSRHSFAQKGTVNALPLPDAFGVTFAAKSVAVIAPFHRYAGLYQGTPRPLQHAPSCCLSAHHASACPYLHTVVQIPGLADAAPNPAALFPLPLPLPLSCQASPLSAYRAPDQIVSSCCR